MNPEVSRDTDKLEIGTKSQEMLERLRQEAVRQGTAEPDGLPTIDNHDCFEFIGCGGFGTVWRARDRALNRVVAVKTLHTSEFNERFRLEAESIAKLDHPNIIRIHKFEVSGDRPYFSMEYCGNGSLRAYLKKHGPFAARDCARLIMTLALAIDHAHKNKLIHRDLKPENILLTDEFKSIADCEALKIGDFGLVKLLERNQGLTRTGEQVGTTSCMAPEQFHGIAGPQVDVYALGVMLFELITGKKPYEGDTAAIISQVTDETNDPPSPSSIVPVPIALEEICLKCLQKSPKDRYQSAALLAQDLERFLNDEQVDAVRRSLKEKIWRMVGRSGLTGDYSRWAALLLFTAILGGFFNIANWCLKQLNWQATLVTLNIASKAVYVVVFIWGWRITRQTAGEENPDESAETKQSRKQARQIYLVLTGNAIACSLYTIAANASRGDLLSFETWKNNLGVPLWCIANAFCSFVLATTSFSLRWLKAAACCFLGLAVITAYFQREAPFIFGIAWFFAFGGAAFFIFFREKRRR